MNSHKILQVIACACAVIVGAASLSAAEVPTADFFVSPTGNDAHEGTRERPVATLARARDLVRAAIAEKPRSITVLLRGGVYVLSDTVRFDERDSAQAGHTVTYAAYPNERVVISGGREITGFRVWGDVWEADVPEARDGKWPFEQLFVNEQRRTWARTPNAGFFRVEKAGPDRRTSFSFKAGDLRAWPDASEASITFLHDWSTSRVMVREIREEDREIEFTDPIGPNAPHYAIDHFEPHPRYFLEGAHSFLDAPGEWWLDRAAGKLIYKPLPGELPEKFVAMAARLPSLLELTGKSQGPSIAGVKFQGITFAHTEWPLPEHGFAGRQSGFYENRDPQVNGAARLGRNNASPAVKVDFAERITFENCRFTQLGGVGIWLEQRCVDCTLAGCEFSDIAGNGIMIGEVASRGDDLVTRGVSVRNCRISNCGVRDFGAVGVWIGLAANCTVERNDISQLPYTGVSVGWKWSTEPTSCRGHTIAGNHIHHVLLTLSDGGGIYTLGRQPGTRLVGNHIHAIPANAGRAESNGLFLDEGSSEFTIEQNTIYDLAKSPVRFHKATGLTLRENRLAAAAGVPTFRYNAASPESMTFERNEEIADPEWRPPAEDAIHRAGKEK